MPTYVTNLGLIVADAPDPSWKLTAGNVYLVPGNTVKPQEVGYDCFGQLLRPTPAQAMASYMASIGNLKPQAGLESADTMNDRI